MSVPTLDEVLARPRTEVPAEHMTAALFAVIAEELLEQIELLEAKGLSYAREYLRYWESPKGGAAPRAPLGMNPRVADAVREVVRDHAMNARFTLGRRS
jgi:hypothetical protein